MIQLVPIALTALGVYGAYKVYDHFKNALVQGNLYLMTLTFDPTKGDAAIMLQGKTGKDLQKAAAFYITTWLTQAGFLVNDGATTDAAQAANVLSGRPSQWKFVAEWQGPGAMLLVPANPAIPHLHHEKLMQDLGFVPGQVEGGTPGLVDALTQGNSYSILATFDPTKGDAAVMLQGKSGDDAKNAAIFYLKTWFSQCGFKVTSDPVIRSNQDMSQFLAGQVSQWVIMAQWTQPGTKITLAPNPAVPDAQFQTLPVQKAPV